MNKLQHLLVIEGPTASGKTALAVELALHFNTVIISADSRQFYKEIAIGTAKPDSDEMKGVRHYFIDSHSIQDPLTAGVFADEAMHLLQTELKDFPIVVVVGGSGMFIDALCIGLDPIPTSELIQEQLRNELEVQGLDALVNELKKTDPEFYKEVDKSNPVRIMRALEAIRLTGEKFSTLRQHQIPPRPFKVSRFVIDWPREQLYNRINQRVDNMMDLGLEAEVKAMLPFRSLTTLQTVGYKELFLYFDGACTLDQAVDKIKQHTRNYAKRQLTWFRRHPNSTWINPQNNLFKQVLDALDNEVDTILE